MRQPRNYVRINLLRSAATLTGVAALAGLLLLNGCATEAPVKPKEKTPDLVWPSPPEPAVIRYVGMVSKLDDPNEKEKASFKDILAGKESEEPAKALNKPWGVYSDSNRLFVADTGLGALIVFDLNTLKTERWGTEGSGKLIKPISVTADAQGRIYVCDQLGKRIVVFDSAGKYVTSFGGKEVFLNPVTAAVNDRLGRIYVVDSQKHQVLVFDMKGKLQFTVGKKGGAPGDFLFPAGIAIDSEGRFYVSDTLNFRVQIFSADGKFIKTFGELGQNPGTFTRPKGIALDKDGHIYVVDAAFGNFQVFDTEGRLLLFVGSNGNRPGEFFLPTGIAIDRHDRIYVADPINHRVQIFQYLGEPGATKKGDAAVSPPSDRS